MRFFLCALLCCFFFLPIHAQKRSGKKLHKTAIELIKVEDYATGCPMLASVDSIYHSEPDYLYYKGVCLFTLQNKAAALPYFQQALLGGYSDHKVDFYLGRSYHFNLLFDTAKFYYNRYLKDLDTVSSHKKHNVQVYHEIIRYLGNCDLGKQMVADSLDIRIENIGPHVNGIYPDYSPVVSADESVLFFTSRRVNSTGGEIADDGKFYEDIYMSYRDSSGKWGDPIQMGDSINTPGHDACIGLTPDGQKLFIYRSYRKTDASGDLYMSQLKGHNWSIPEKIHGDINTKSWESSLSISPNEEFVFFASDRKGGYGGSDLYYMRKGEDGKYHPPVNLGPSVNTPYDEDSPLIHVDGKTLFFSSKGHPGMGGFDFFSSVFSEEDSTWSVPTNMGYPISTPGDDIYLSYTADGSRCYFSSYRHDSFGEKDLYIIHRPDDSPAMVVFKGFIKDEETNLPVSATITLSDPETGKIENVFNSNSATGKYLVVLGFDKTYDVTIEAPGYMYKSEQIHIPMQKASVFEYVRNFFVQLVKQNSANASLETDLSSSRIVLKTRKAKAVQNVKVTSKNDVSEEENWKGHKMDYTNARFSSEREAQNNKNIHIFNADSGFVLRQAIVYNHASFKAESDNLYTMNISMERLEAGSKFVLRNIHFDFDKDIIRDVSKKELDRLYSLLDQNKSIYLEIGGHTDNRGGLQYNIDLSKRRAQAVVNYLTNKGIDAKRLKSNGYGETMPITSNTTDWGRQFNRRTEFEVLDTALHYLNKPIKANDHTLAKDYWRQLPMKVHFEKNVSHTLYPFSKSRLDELIAFLKYNKTLDVVLVARADESIEKNPEQLIKDRAELVKRYLGQKGISKGRIAVHMSKNLPSYLIPVIIPGEISNRCVEFYIIN